MVSKSDRVLYVGTWEGLYAATENGGTYDIRLLGLESPPPPKDWKLDHRRLNPAGKGRLTPPVVIDKDDPRRLYAGTTRAGIFISEDSVILGERATKG